LELGRDLFGLSAQAKARLIDKLSSASAARPPGHSPRRSSGETVDAAAQRFDASALEGFREIGLIREAAQFLDIADPFFRVHEGIAGAETLIGNKTYINFASYNYIGLNGHPRISEAAKAAIDRYGSWSRRWRASMAARIVSRSSADIRRTLLLSGICSGATI
jgi:8-amino-7-oxononanoate synthase